MRSASAQKYFYLYEIKNLINGKIYIGIHATYKKNSSVKTNTTAPILAVKGY